MLGFFISLLIYMIVILSTTYYNHLHREKYYEMMAYLRNHHPETASQLELKRVLGFLYPSGAFGPSIRYARKHEPLDDPVAEELLDDYARLSDRAVWCILAFVISASLLFFFGGKLLDQWLSP
jgi:hypothetical protein